MNNEIRPITMYMTIMSANRRHEACTNRYAQCQQTTTSLYNHNNMRIAFTVLTTILLLLGQSNGFGQRKFELGDLDKLYTLTDPQISPDGKSILIVVSKPDTTINKKKT